MSIKFLDKLDDNPVLKNFMIVPVISFNNRNKKTNKQI